MKAILFLVLIGAGAPAFGQSLEERAIELQKSAFVMDAHMHFINPQFYLGGDIGDPSPFQVDLPKLRQGGVKAVFFTVFTPEDYYPQHFEVKQMLRLINLALEQIHKNSDTIELALTASDIERIQRDGKIAAVLDLEGGFDMDGDLGVLRALYRLGVRSVQIVAHNWTNQFADSCCAPARWNGITEHGRAVVREMNRLGMVVNVSHASEATFLQVVDASARPVIATHQGLRRFNDIPRNATDEMIKNLAAKGGVVAVHFGQGMYNPRFFEWWTKRAGAPFFQAAATRGYQAVTDIAEIDQRVRRSYQEGPLDPPDDVLEPVSKLADVIDYCVQVVGEDHVALGSDFGGGLNPPRGMKNVSQYAMVTQALLEKGYSEERIRKILGGNLLRVFREITSQGEGLWPD